MNSTLEKLHESTGLSDKERKVIDTLWNNKDKFVTVIFTKSDGTQRYMNCIPQDSARKDKVSPITERGKAMIESSAKNHVLPVAEILDHGWTQPRSFRLDSVTHIYLEDGTPLYL